MADETISEKCETLYNKLNTFVASVISRDVTPKISNLNTEVWGSNTQTGNSRIDTLNTEVWGSNTQGIPSRIDNLEARTNDLAGTVNSLNTSITNLIQVQYVSTASASCNSLASITRSATVTACPEGYSWLFVPIGSYRSLTRVTGLSGTTITFDVTNISSSTQNVSAVGRLIYYPNTWNI